MRSWISAILLGFVSCLACGEESSLSKEDESSVHEVVSYAMQAILNEKPMDLFKYISSQEGLSCTDTTYKTAEIKKFLINKSSHFYASLFSTASFLAQCSSEAYPKEFPPISEKQFFGSETRIEITKNKKSWVTVKFTSVVKSYYPREWYLHKEQGRWRIGGGSFIIGDCACG